MKAAMDISFLMGHLNNETKLLVSLAWLGTQNMKLLDNTEKLDCHAAGILCMYCSRDITTLKDRFVLYVSKTKKLMIYHFKMYLINVPIPNNSTAIQILN